MIFNYGGVLASANIMVSRLLEGEEGTYFNLKLNESEVSWIGSIELLLNCSIRLWQISDISFSQLYLGWNLHYLAHFKPLVQQIRKEKNCID